MITIFDIYDSLQGQLKSIGLPIYKEIKPTTETGNCIVINSIPLSKNNVNSVIDIVPILYLKKLNSQFDKISAQRISPLIENGITAFILNNVFVTVTERLDPNTINLDDSYTTTEFIFKLITH